MSRNTRDFIIFYGFAGRNLFNSLQFIQKTKMYSEAVQKLHTACVMDLKNPIIIRSDETDNFLVKLLIQFSEAFHLNYFAF